MNYAFNDDNSYLSPFSPETIKERYLAESLIWRHLDRPTPKFRYVQDPVFNLTPYEVVIIEYLRSAGLVFTLRPRYDPSSFINLSVTLERMTQRVRLEVHQGLSITCTFITERNEFAGEFKGWLDRCFGGECFTARKYVATRHYVNYPYLLPVDIELMDMVLQSPLNIQDDTRNSQQLFNFSIKEKHFLNLFEKAVLSFSDSENDPIYVQIYPRQTAVGSIESVINDSTQRQPSQVFISGYHPMSYQCITENTRLGMRLFKCLNKALGENNLDTESSRLKGKYLSLIYNVRYPLDLLDSFEDE